MDWQSAAHPIWPIIRTVVILGALIVVLKMNAQHFDETEIKTILTMFFALLGAEGITQAISKSRST